MMPMHQWFFTLDYFIFNKIKIIEEKIQLDYPEVTVNKLKRATSCLTQKVLLLLSCDRLVML